MLRPRILHYFYSILFNKYVTLFSNKLNCCPMLNWISEKKKIVPFCIWIKISDKFYIKIFLKTNFQTKTSRFVYVIYEDLNIIYSLLLYSYAMLNTYCEITNQVWTLEGTINLLNHINTQLCWLFPLKYKKDYWYVLGLKKKIIKNYKTFKISRFFYNIKMLNNLSRTWKS